MDLALECLQKDLKYSKTEEFILEPKNVKNGRSLVQAKNTKYFELAPYPQVFQAKYGFINDISSVDLIFN